MSPSDCMGTSFVAKDELAGANKGKAAIYRGKNRRKLCGIKKQVQNGLINRYAQCRIKIMKTNWCRKH